MMALNFTYDQTIDICRHLLSYNLKWESNAKDHAFDGYDLDGNKVLKFSLPVLYQVPESNQDLEAFMASSWLKPQEVLHVQIQAGEAAIGWATDRELAFYKVIRKYMTRKKQGKTQLSHLKTKGKSRAGSRIRLAQSVKFFEEINAKMEEWLESNTPDIIVLGVSQTLWPFWKESKVAIPFLLDDPCIRSANWDIGLPRKESLKKAIWHSHSGKIHIFDPNFESDIRTLLSNEK